MSYSQAVHRGQGGLSRAMRTVRHAVTAADKTNGREINKRSGVDGTAAAIKTVRRPAGTKSRGHQIRKWITKDSELGLRRFDTKSAG